MRRPGTHEGRQVKLRRQPGVLRDAHRLAVEPEVQHALRAAHMEDDPAPGPIRRHLQHGAVQARGILFRHRRRRVVERHDDVRVMRPVVAVHRPVAGHGQLGPRRVGLELRADKLGRHVLGTRHEPEVPLAVERLPPRRCGPVVAPRRGGGGIREERRAGRQAVERQRFGVLPGLEGAGLEQVHGKEMDVQGDGTRATNASRASMWGLWPDAGITSMRAAEK